MMRRLLPWLVLLALVGAGCDAAVEDTTTTTAATTSTTTSTTVAPTSTAPQSACLAGELAFSGDGIVAALGRDAGDATILSGVTVVPDAGCERIVLDFATADGAPASSLGRIDVRLLRDVGVIRVSLPAEVGTAAITDGVLETDLVDAFYVVRAEDRGLFIDFHLADAVAARASFSNDPMRMVMDLRPGDLPLGSRPARGPLAVILTPGSGPAGYPLRVTGYGRPFEATLVWRLYKDDQIVDEGFTMTTDYIDAWGWFTFDVPAGPAGEVGLFAGDLDQQTGLPRGARVTLEIP